MNFRNKRKEKSITICSNFFGFLVNFPEFMLNLLSELSEKRECMKKVKI